MGECFLNFKKYKWLYLYYLILHFICLSWTETSMVQPSVVLRLTITAAVFIPLIRFFWMAPAVITLFVGLRFNSVAPFGYIPQSWMIYEYLIFVIAILHSILYKNKRLLFFSKKQLLFILFILFVEVYNSQFDLNLILFVLLLIILYNSIKDNVALTLIILSFVILTITLSIYYFIFYKEFAIAYMGSESERSSWVDPNYFGILLGCGVILSGAYLFSPIKTNISLLYKIVFLLCIVLGFLTIALQASRGAMLAIAIPLIIQIFFSKIRLFPKIAIILVTLVAVIFIYESGYLGLLLNRIETDDGTGNGRSTIWMLKMSEWIKNPLNYLGCGYQSAIYKFSPIDTDCHNEFVSIIINWGIVGVIIILTTVINILRIPSNRVFFISILSFIFVAFMTLSPITCQTGWNSCPLMIILLYKCINIERNKKY